MSSCLNLLFNSLDFFKFPLSFTLEKQQKSSTPIGKLITLGIFIFLVYNLCMSDLVSKKDAQTLSQDLIQPSRPDMFFSKENFTLAFGIADVNNVFSMDETIFSIVFYQYHINNNDQTVNNTQIWLHPCTKEDFIENPDEFDTLGLNGTFCISNAELRLRGYWDEENLDYFYLQVVVCQNSSENNITCQSNEEIDQFFEGSYIDIYLTNHNINSANYQNPLSRELKIYYYMLDTGLYKDIQFYMKQAEIDTDDGFFFDSISTIVSYIHDTITCDIKLQKAGSGLPILEIDFYSSSLKTEINRTYQKIQTLLAQLGGICNFLFVIGFLITKLQHNYKVISILSSELFIFPRTHNNKENNFFDAIKSSFFKKPEQKILPNNFFNNQNSESNHKKFDTLQKIDMHESLKNKELRITLNKSSILNSKKEVELEENMKFSNGFHENQIPNVSFFKKTMMSFKSISLKSHQTKKIEKADVGFNLAHYRKMKQKENSFSVGFFNFLKLYLKNYDHMTTQEKLFVEAKNQIAEELDIVKLLNKLQDIDKLKRIVLSDEQMFFFELLSKPMIVPHKSLKERSGVKLEDRRFKFSFQNKNDLNPEKIGQLYNEMKIRSECSEIDRRIMKLLDEDVKCFLDNEKV